MERLDPSGKPSYSPADRSRKKNRSKQIRNTSFSAVIGDSIGGEPEIDGGMDLPELSGVPLEELLDEIHSVGERVKQDATYESVRRYKTAVKALVKYVVDHALNLEERQSSPNILRQKKFMLIKVIDKKLDSLASGVLMNQHDALDILGKIDEINGLIVDLVS